MENKYLIPMVGIIGTVLVGVVIWTIVMPSMFQSGSESEPKLELETVDILVDEIEKDLVKIRVRNKNPRPEGYIPDSLMIDIVGVNLYYHINGSFFTTITGEQEGTHFPVEPLEPEEEGEIWLRMHSIEYKPNWTLPYEKWEAQVIGKRLDTNEENFSQLSIVPEYSEWMYCEELKMVKVAQDNTSVIFEIINQGVIPIEISYVKINEVPLEGSSWTITKNPIPVQDRANLTIYYSFVAENKYQIDLITGRGNKFPYVFTGV